jgi:hypothetical protein
VTEPERDDLRGKILLEEHQVKKELQAYIVKLEKAREGLEEIANRLRKFTSALDPTSALSAEAIKYPTWSGVDLPQTGEDCQKALKLRERLDAIKIHKTRLDL